MMPGTGRRAASEPCRTCDVCGSSCHRLASPPPDVDGLDHPGLDELAQSRLRDTDVAAYPGEPDAPLRDQPPRKPGRRIKQFGYFLKGEQPVMNQIHVHIASPSVGLSGSGSAIGPVVVAGACSRGEGEFG